jgi:hypothetical protein
MMNLAFHREGGCPMPLRRWIATIGMVALTGLVPGKDLAVAADLAVIPRHSVKSRPVTSKPVTSKPDMPLEKFATGANASCTAWTDDCRSCGKGPSGVFCSNVGIACLPSLPHCTRH